MGYRSSVNLRIPVKNRNVFVFFVFLFVITCSLDGDFYHYQQMVKNYNFLPGASNHGEPIYKYIIGLIDRNYLLFRIIVWGGALMLYKKTLKNLGLNVNHTLFVMFALYILVFSYARASLAMAVYFWGLSICITSKTNSYIGIAIICCSYCFHHSIIIAIAITPVIFIKINKKILILSLIVIPLLFLLLKGTIQQIMFDGTILNNEEVQGKLELYSNREISAVNWKGMIYEFSGYLTFFLPFLLCINTLYLKKNNYIPIYIQILLKITFALILISVMFLFLDIQGKVFFYRILYMTFIPLSIITYYIYSSGYIKKKTFCRIINIGIIAQLYRLFYSIYLYM